MRRVTVMLLSAAVVAFAPAARAADEPKDIIAKAIKAQGGEEVLTKYQGFTAKNKGKLQIAGVGETDFISNNALMLPDKLKEEVELSIGGQKITLLTLASGDNISITANGNEVPVNDNIKKAITHARYMAKAGRLTALLKDKGYELSLVGEAEVNKAKAIGVKVAMKGQADVNLYFDAKTYLMVKIESRTVDPNTGNEITEERIIHEYQKTDEGMQVPKKVSVVRDGKPYMEADIVEFKLHEKLDDSEFKK